MFNNSLNDERAIEEKARAAKDALKKQKTRAPKNPMKKQKPKIEKFYVVLFAILSVSICIGLFAIVTYFIPELFIAFKIALILEIIVVAATSFVTLYLIINALHNFFDLEGSLALRSAIFAFVFGILLLAHVFGMVFMIELDRFGVDEIVVADNGYVYEVVDGSYYLYSCGQEMPDIVISELPENIAGFSTAGFKEKDAVETIVIDVPGFRINEKAFDSWKNLKTVTFTGGDYTIGWNAFKNCYKLESVTLEGGTYTFPSGVLFKNCSQLQDIYLKNGDFRQAGLPATKLRGVKNVNVHLINVGPKPKVKLSGAEKITLIAYKGTTGIGLFKPDVIVFVNGFDFDDNWTVHSPGLLSTPTAPAPKIYLPDSVTNIPERVFGKKNSPLDVYYQGSKEMWNNVEIADTEGWGSNSIINNSKNFTMHYNSNCTQWENPTNEGNGQ